MVVTENIETVYNCLNKKRSTGFGLTRVKMKRLVKCSTQSSECEDNRIETNISNGKGNTYDLSDPDPKYPYSNTSYAKDFNVGRLFITFFMEVVYDSFESDRHYTVKLMRNK